MHCAVCGKPAEPLPKTHDGDGFHCATCGDYVVSGTVITSRWLEGRSPTELLKALENAKRQAQPGKLPVITTYSL
ncbi:hypothetical protein ACVW1A_006639 [Bradyrhizobium sp. LB1.3]